MAISQKQPHIKLNSQNNMKGSVHKYISQYLNDDDIIDDDDDGEDDNDDD